MMRLFISISVYLPPISVPQCEGNFISQFTPQVQRRKQCASNIIIAPIFPHSLNFFTFISSFSETIARNTVIIWRSVSFILFFRSWIMTISFFILSMTFCFEIMVHSIKGEYVRNESFKSVIFSM